MKDEEKHEEGLELDKLDVSSMTVPPAKIPRFKRKQDKGEVSRRRVSTIRSILVFVSKEKIFICAFLAGLLVASPVVYLSLTRSSSDRAGSGDSYVGSIVYVVSSSIAERHHVRFKLSIPFSNNKEKAGLMQKLPTIKHELSISGSRPDVAQSIEQKDLKTLKKQILEIVNDVTGVPTKELHLKELTLDPTVGNPLSNTS